MDLNSQVLSNLAIYMKYSRYLNYEKRRETWEEITDRVKLMHLNRFPKLTEEIEEAFKFVYNKEVLPSMRSSQYSGVPIELNNCRLYNCCSVQISNWKAFGEIVFLLMSGVGVSWSIQKQHVIQLPEIKTRLLRTRRFLIGDSLEGWCDAIKILVKSYFFGLSMPKFDFRDIRPKGSKMKTSGGIAPGPQPLKDCIHQIESIFNSKQSGTKLTPLECHDIICHLADMVLAGGNRRAAGLALFSFDDVDMMTCKSGNWWELNPQRSRANNSVCLLRHKLTKNDWDYLWERIKLGKSGEPAYFLTYDNCYNINPCGEISIKTNSSAGGLCNLTTINLTDVTTQEELNKRSKVAAFIGTLQASYTDFHYLRNEWNINVSNESLLGVSMTGIANNKILKLDFIEASNITVEENARISELLNINKAKRLTCVKPDGTSSLVCNSSSGIHPWFSNFYIRRVRVLKSEVLYRFMAENIPELVEDDAFKPHLEAVISIPIRAPEGSITRSEGALDLLERILKITKEWILPGHIAGANHHNVSATVFYKDNEELELIKEFLWEHKDVINCCTVLPLDGGTYVQAPYEEITEEKFDELSKYVRKIDFSLLKEYDDKTKLRENIACSGNSCELSF